MLVRHNREIQRQGGTFALAGPQAAVLRVLSVTGLLTWFEVHDTVYQAVASPGGLLSWPGPAQEILTLLNDQPVPLPLR